MLPRNPLTANHAGRELQLIAVLVVQMVALMTASCGGDLPGEKISAGDEIGHLQEKLVEMKYQEELLRQEYSLARNPAPYLVVNLSDRNIELKAQGRILRSFELKNSRRLESGKDDGVTWILREVKPIQRTERPKIKAGAGEEAMVEAAKQELWGLHRMPRDYDLVCKDNNFLEICALPSKQSGFRFTRAIRTMYRRTAGWYRRWRMSKDVESQHVIQLWLDENDSRLLFWSLPKQLKILILDESILSRVSSNSCLTARTLAALR